MKMASHSSFTTVLVFRETSSLPRMALNLFVMLSALVLLFCLIADVQHRKCGNP